MEGPLGGAGGVWAGRGRGGCVCRERGRSAVSFAIFPIFYKFLASFAVMIITVIIAIISLYCSYFFLVPALFQAQKTLKTLWLTIFLPLLLPLQNRSRLRYSRLSNVNVDSVRLGLYQYARADTVVVLDAGRALTWVLYRSVLNFCSVVITIFFYGLHINNIHGILALVLLRETCILTLVLLGKHTFLRTRGDNHG